MANEKRLIYLDDVLADLHGVLEAANADTDEIMRMAEACVSTLIKHFEKFPTVDAVEVIHGKWKDKQTNSIFTWHLECSVCGSDYHTSVGYNYCPNCGAKMDGERRANDLPQM